MKETCKNQTFVGLRPYFLEEKKSQWKKFYCVFVEGTRLMQNSGLAYRNMSSLQEL